MWPGSSSCSLVYCCANGGFSSRRIERAPWRGIGVRYVTAGAHPAHDTIAKFRPESLGLWWSGS